MWFKTLLCFFLITVGLAAMDSEEDRFFEDLSLEELLTLELTVPAALTRMTQAEIPASFTTIHARDISESGARNILDLLEIYVPGAIWMNHEQGPHPGIRGILINRNYKYLLLVNGRVLNSKVRYGAKSELEQWNIDDISQIQIVRGPGSVTYGPGAVGGVISITTHDGVSRPGTNLHMRHVSEYDANGFSVSTNYEKGGFKLFAFASAMRTQGTDAPHVLVTRDNEVGTIGQEIFLGEQPLDFFNDLDDDPQIKLHLDMSFGASWRLWLRYANQGSSWRGNEVKSELNGEFLNQTGLRDRHFVAHLSHQREINPKLKLESVVSFDSLDYEYRSERINWPEDLDHPLNKRNDAAEHEILIRQKLHWEPNPDFKAAFGFEYAFDQFGKGWGDDLDDMRMGERGIIVSGPDSRAILEGNQGNANLNGTAIFVEDGWETDTWSFFAESNYRFLAGHKLILSTRFDKNTYTEWLFSPRLAYVHRLLDRHFLKLIAQRSVRMNTAEELFIEDRAGRRSSDETLEGIELIYTAFPQEHLRLEAAVYRNDIEVIGWTGEENRTVFVGDLSLWGVDLSGHYSWRGHRIGGSYTFAKQLDWKLAEDLNSSGISYSDYREPVGQAVQNGFGNDLNNWPTQSLKVFTTLELVPGLTLAVNSQYLHDYQGSRDGLTGLSLALQGSERGDDVDAVLEELDRLGVYDVDWRTNATLTFAFGDHEVRFGAQNLFGEKHAKRYAYDAGNDDPAPRRVRYVEEPVSFGLSVNLRF